MGRIREDKNGFRSRKLKKRRPDFFQVHLNLYESVRIYSFRKYSLFVM